jgi:hypothetical protein
MPRGTGSGQGAGSGQGRGQGRGRGMTGGTRPGAGPAGYCICPGCGEKVAHQAGVPCYSVKCPKCGLEMVRK